MLDGGWVKLYRKMWDNPRLRKPAYLAVWVWVLSHVEYRDESEAASVIWEGQRYWLKKGEVACGTKQIAEEIGVSRATVLRALEVFKSDGQIGQQTSNKFSLITVNNWERYQETRTTSGQQTDNGRTTNGQPADTYRKNIRIKEGKNIRNLNTESADRTQSVAAPKLESSPEWVRAVPEADQQELMTKYRIEASTLHACTEDLIDYCEAKGRRYKNYKAALRNFIKSHIARHPECVRRKIEQPQHAQLATDQPRTPEEQARIDAKLKEVRDGLSKKFSMS